MGFKKAFLMLGLVAMILVLSPEVTARDLKEAEFVKETNEVGPIPYGNPYPVPPGNGGSCSYGCCRWTSWSGCTRCCSYAGEAVAVQTQDKTHN